MAWSASGKWPSPASRELVELVEQSVAARNLQLKMDQLKMNKSIFFSNGDQNLDAIASSENLSQEIGGVGFRRVK
ncbi:MAG: hypothetical protein DCF15_22515 [Phormidesmis priestleyi]|uniref:Uncharacterized protein n=1 Tax=Phormidesmis priestleyi TaxID=268141 RepID=A0A2W4WNY3_9CYAN|nr:MAG: hypothetical protein DCF15_22515 [Phormidesmis priestleyi]